MTATTYTIWIGTRAGQRMLLASTPCRTFALLIGEAVWTHLCQRRTTALDACLVEVLAASPGKPDVPRMLARWSNAGEEKPQVNTSPIGKPAASLLVSSPSGVPEANVAARAGLAAFFPTAEEWASWAAWRGEHL